MPFLLLVCGLLGGALVSALGINVTLATGSFKITELQQQDSQLARQSQQLQVQVAAERSAAQITQRAYQLGMRPVGLIRYIDLNNGQIETGGGSATDVPETAP
jgi:predicted ATP-dependent serine protease